jgi:hypothetical protein
MDVGFTHCAGLDVHQKTVMACRVTPDPTGQQADGIMEVKEFGTLTRDRWPCPTGWPTWGSRMSLWKVRASTGAPCTTFWKGSSPSSW